MDDSKDGKINAWASDNTSAQHVENNGHKEEEEEEAEGEELYKLLPANKAGGWRDRCMRARPHE